MSAQGFPVHNLILSNTDEFVQDWHVRVTYVALLTLWVFWGLVWVARNFLIGDLSSTTPEATTADAEVSHKKFNMANGSFAVRVDRAHQLVKDTLFSLLCLLVINSFARASTRAVMILAWFFVAFAVFWFVVELVVDNRYVRLLYSIVFYGLGLAIGGLAYKQGFY